MSLPALSSHFSLLSLQGLTSPGLQEQLYPSPNTKPPPSFLAIQNLTSRPTRNRRKGPSSSSQSLSTDIESDLPVPTELLHLIFALALEASSSDIDIEEKVLLRNTILAISHTSRRWRYTARDCSNLWTHAIDFEWQPVKVVADLLKLSQPHLIDIGHRSEPFTVATHREVSILDLLKPESRRIREWNVEFPPAEDQPRVGRGWLFPFTEQPSLTAVRYQVGFTSLLWDLRALAPTLRKLSIIDTRLFLPLRPPMPPFDVLTELRVTNVSMDFRPSVQEWLTILHAMPNLQFLAIHNAIHAGMGGFNTNHVFPQLRVLSLQDSEWSAWRVISRLFPHLLVPASCATQLEFPSTSYFVPTDDTELITVMDGFWRTLRNRITGGSASLHTTDIPQVEIAVTSSTKGGRVAFGTVRSPEVTLDWNGERGTDGLVEYLDDHETRYQRYPPLNIVFNQASANDVSQLLILARNVFSESTSLRIHVDAFTASRASFQEITPSLVSLLSRMLLTTTLILNLDAHSILLAVRRYGVMVPVSDGTLLPMGLPNLKKVVLEGTPGDKATPDRYMEDANAFVIWRRDVGFPATVEVRPTVRLV